jgi:phage baseplate assembly protein gpV
MDEPADRPGRRRLLGLAAAAASGLAGCASPFGRDEGRTSGPDSERSGDREREAGPGATAAADAGSGGATVGGVFVRNLASRRRYLTLVVTRDGEELAVESRDLARGAGFAVTDLVRPGAHRVVVETADGARREYDWTVTRDLPDLQVELTPGIAVSRPFRCLRDCGPLAEVQASPPADFREAATDRRGPRLVLDNDTTEPRTARLVVADGGETTFAADYDLPPAARAVVPVAGRRRAYRLELTSEARTVVRRWRPQLNRRLYATLADGPAFRCGRARHDLRVANETDARRVVAVTVAAGDERVFDRRFDLDAGETAAVTAAVAPLGRLGFTVAVEGGRTERYDWGFCAPRGPLSVTVSENGIDVAVSPDGG